MKKTNSGEKKELGASLVEYGLLVALIAVVCIAAVRTFGNELNAKLHDTADVIGGSTDACDPFADPDC